MGFTPKSVGPMSEDRKQLHDSLDGIARKQLLDPKLRMQQAQKHEHQDHEFFMANERLKRALRSKDNIKSELDDFDNIYRGMAADGSNPYNRNYDQFKKQQEHQEIRDLIQRVRDSEGHSENTPTNR